MFRRTLLILQNLLYFLSKIHVFSKLKHNHEKIMHLEKKLREVINITHTCYVQNILVLYFVFYKIMMLTIKILMCYVNIIMRLFEKKNICRTLKYQVQNILVLQRTSFYLGLKISIQRNSTMEDRIWFNTYQNIQPFWIRYGS